MSRRFVEPPHYVMRSAGPYARHMHRESLSDRPPKNADGVAIDIDGVIKSFGSVQAVAGISLQIRSGETVAVLGPNGAGKTTLLGILLDLQSPDAGRVRLFGTDPRSAVASGRVGAMLQDGGLMPGVRVVELLRFLRRLYPAPMALDQAIALAQAGDFLHQRVDRLSGGQLQRVRVAVALVGDADLLLLDEPTAAMDVEARRRFWEGMDEQAGRGKTILFSTHNLEEVDGHADRVVVIARGRVLADGSPAAIKARVGLRSLRSTLSRRDAAQRIRALPGVASVTLRGDRLEVLSSQTDAVLHTLLRHDPGAHDFEITGLGLEDAFLALTGGAASQTAERAA
jgi:ABC-2 type transport system ATP-binding protein